MFSIRTILHPTDFSGNAELAFELACSVAADHSARLVVLHIEEQQAATYGEAISPPPSGRGALEEQLQGIKSSDAKVRVEHRLEQGVSASEILRVAHETDCDLIIMGTQGKMGVGKSVLPGRWVGSVAGKVLQSAPCRVVMVNIPAAVADR
jgi:nucleotide-binding universal stress UspA family protein